MGIEFVGVQKSYVNNSILKDVSFSVEKGEFVTIVGHSGAGKTTLFRTLLGSCEPERGRVCYDGQDIYDLSTSELLNYRRRIGTIFQTFRLLSTRTVFENIAFAMEVFGYEDDRIEKDVPYVLELVDLKDKVWAFPDELSGGEQQRTAIARSIVRKPEVLIADEPTGNLDPVNTYEVINILKQIHKLGTTILLATHDRTVVEGIRSRVITLADGGIVKDDPNGKYIL